MNVDNLENIDVEEVVKRLCLLLGIKSDRKLSTELGLSVTTLGIAKKKGKLPWDEILRLCKEKGISVDSLLDIEVSTQANELANSQRRVTITEPIELRPETDEDRNAREINELVDKVVGEALENKTLTADAELRVYKNVRPMLVDTAMRYGKGSEAFMRRQLSSALAMLL